MKTWLPVLLIFFVSLAQAQNERRVQGTVKNEQGETLESVTIKVSGQKTSVQSNQNGQYLILVSSPTISISFSITGYLSRTIDVQFGEGVFYNQDIVLLKDIRSLDEIKLQSNTAKDGAINLSAIENLPSVTGNFESVLKNLPGVSVNNELSSQYSVRGGNFDENLVYINDIEIYRPMLIRNGQQEGLSIINPELVGRVSFYAGGYEAKYGDKLSSVLAIRYAGPDTAEFVASVGITGLSGTVKMPHKDGKGYFLAGIRNKTNQGILNRQEVKGTYQPEFYDMQFLFSRDLHPKLTFSMLGGYNFNRFTLVPADRETTFGTNERLIRLLVDYDGKEVDRYETISAASTLLFKPSGKFNLKWMNSATISSELESFDLTAYYNLEELTKNNLAGNTDTLGLGSYNTYANNHLKSRLYSTELRAYLQFKRSFWEAGLRMERQTITDVLRESKRTDSAGYALPPVYGDYIHSDIRINSARFSTFVQGTHELADGLSLQGGIRVNYSNTSGELLISPRFSMAYRPLQNNGLTLRISSGLYNQPPFYKELRNYDGSYNNNQKAQRSFHLLGGADYIFEKLGTEFTFSSELYFKKLSRLIPYKIDNLRIRYLADQQSHGYAAGADFNLSGQFVAGLESAFRLSLMKTAEDIKGDFYFEKDAFGRTLKIEPGYLRRPTDQRINFSVYFQDKLLQNPSYRVHLTMLYGSALPIGPPGNNRYMDEFKIPAYRRVDIGFSKDFLDKETKWKPAFIQKYFYSFSTFLEVFNLLNINNTVSYLWIKDIHNTSYAIPNYLTARRLNFKIVAKFKNKG